MKLMKLLPLLILSITVTLNAHAGCNCLDMPNYRPCPRTASWWSTNLCAHTSIECLRIGNNIWNRTSLTGWLLQRDSGDQSIALHRELVAVKLNRIHGAKPKGIVPVIAEADALLKKSSAWGAQDVYFPRPRACRMLALAAALRCYNEGGRTGSNCWSEFDNL